MLKKYTFENITWIDLENPTQEEARNLATEYKLHPLVADELLLPTFKPKVDLHKNFIYLILHFPTLKHEESDGENYNKEIDFIIGKDFIITTRYDSILSLENFSKVFEVSTILGDKEKKIEHAGYLFYHITRKLYESLIDELDYIEELQEIIEKNIFDNKEKIMVKEISKVGHNLLDFKQATGHHREVLDSLEIAGENFFGKDFSYYLRSINDKYRNVSHIIKTNQENLKELRETNDSLLTTKQNETMKVFTILAFVTFPLSLLASIFGMNTEKTPIVGMENDFWIIMIGMIIATGIMFSFFKYKKWF
ncbi:MAG: magnesium transporter CorA family protein [Candidatus Pacebacteria bacterium]|nr:magnesium transporter CorA family protein [Candidatus Paceibacterota bacterium]